MDWVEGDVTIDGGVRLHYYRTGTGPPVVLAHGATDNGRCWDRFANVLAGSYELIAYDARYHGKSDAPAGGAITGGEDLLALVDALGVERPALIGHSMGARTVAQAAAMRPAALRCAVLEDPPWWVEPPSGPRRGLENLDEMTVEQVAAAGRAENPSWDEDEFAAWAESKKQFRPTPGWMSGVRDLATGWQQTVAAITAPTLLVCGEVGRGAIVSAEAAEEARAACPALEVVSLAAGHNVRREAFDGFCTAVGDFLARNR
jgi:pimeloyl-ACP methyl ester carboxylesterase